MRRLRGTLIAGISLALSTSADGLITVGELHTPGTARDVEVASGLVYVADGQFGLRIVDFRPEYAPPPPPRSRGIRSRRH